MSERVPRRRRWLSRLLALAFGLLASLAAVEVTLRLLGPAAGRARYESYFEDAQRNRVDYAAARERGLVIEPGWPRNRSTWAPGAVFHMCYRGGKRPYMDERGCAKVEINSLGLRDRADLTWEKPAGQRRVVCIGDSFTFGWGVAEPLTWVRLVEGTLNKQAGTDDVRLVNCGAVGTLYVDEYWWGLRDRFVRLAPDHVIVTLCLNDIALMPNTVALETPWPPMARQQPLALLSALAAVVNFQHRFDLSAEHDWGQVLLDLPPTDGFYAAKAETPDMFWPSGNPQAALRAMRDWCRDRGVGLTLVVWPLFQNLSTDGPFPYPFRTLHRVVAEFCTAEGIAHLDLLPVFLGQRAEDLWVDPSDMHGNEVAHALAAPVVADALAARLRR